MRARLCVLLLPLSFPVVIGAAGIGRSPALAAGSLPGDATALAVDTEFPGGSALVLELDQHRRSVSIRPAPHPGRGWACWWYFHLTGIQPGETVVVQVGEAPWATPDRAVFSTDNRHWQQTAPGLRRGKQIAYRQRIHAREAWFAWGPPFVPADAQSLVATAVKQCGDAQAFELCKTRAGRTVPALEIATAGAATERAGIWVQARQHAWEAGASWVCRGFVEWLVSDSLRARSLRQRARIYVVPIMDVDNVAIGAGGKNQTPHDHNRDWSDTPHWNSVAAAMKKIRELDQRDEFDLFVDLHNPGANAKSPFFYVSPRKIMGEAARDNLDRFLAAAKAEITGPLAFLGQVQESGPSYDDDWERISKNWISRNCRPHVVAVTLETAWNTPDSTVTGYLTVGRQLGLAIDQFVTSGARGSD